MSFTQNLGLLLLVLVLVLALFTGFRGGGEDENEEDIPAGEQFVTGL